MRSSDLHDQDCDWFVQNLPGIVRTPARYRSLVEQVQRSNDENDLEELRAAVRHFHDPTLGRECRSPAAPHYEEVASLIDGRLQTLRQSGEAKGEQQENRRSFWSRLRGG
jgi:hypothetical protein